MFKNCYVSRWEVNTNIGKKKKISKFDSNDHHLKKQQKGTDINNRNVHAAVWFRYVSEVKRYCII
jgi:hypothetical protein